MEQNSILKGNILITLIALAIPIMLNNLLQTCYNLTDTFWLGKLGPEHMAAITLVSPIQSVITNFGSGLTAGASVILSQCFGADNIKQSVKTTEQIFFLMMSFSVFAALLLFFGCGAMIHSMGAEGNVYTMAVLYQKIMAADIPFIFIVNIYTSVSNAEGKTKKTLALNLIGIIINMVLDPIFLFILKLGAGGAALATVLSKLPCSVIAIFLLTRKTNLFHISLFNIRPDKKIIFNIIKIGLPMGIGNSAMQFGFVLMSKNVMSYGTAAVAAYGIGNKLNSIITTPSAAMGNAVSILSGHAKGADMQKRGIQAMFTGMLIMTGLMAVTGFILSRDIISRNTSGIFSSDTQVISAASDFLSVMSVMAWSNGIYDTSKGYLNGQGKTLSTVIINVARLWVFRFAVMFICEHIFHMGIRSIWYAVTFSNAIASVFMGLLAILEIRKYIAKIHISKS
ncbi:MAG: MATE family efflux transporter [bacterium]|nr:MATE family efflux transporter [bacterium]